MNVCNIFCPLPFIYLILVTSLLHLVINTHSYAWLWRAIQYSAKGKEISRRSYSLLYSVRLLSYPLIDLVSYREKTIRWYCHNASSLWNMHRISLLLFYFNFFLSLFSFLFFLSFLLVFIFSILLIIIGYFWSSDPSLACFHHFATFDIPCIGCSLYTITVL